MEDNKPQNKYPWLRQLLYDNVQSCYYVRRSLMKVMKDAPIHIVRQEWQHDGVEL